MFTEIHTSGKSFEFFSVEANDIHVMNRNIDHRYIKYIGFFCWNCSKINCLLYVGAPVYCLYSILGYPFEELMQSLIITLFGYS